MATFSAAHSGKTQTGRVSNSSSQFWNDAAFEPYSAADTGSYDIAMTYDSVSLDAGTFPATIAAGIYTVSIWSNGLMIGNFLANWDGTTLAASGTVGGGTGFGSIPGYNSPFPAATDLRSGKVVGTTTGTLGVPPNTNVLFDYFYGPDDNGNYYGLLVPGSGDVATTYSVGSQINSSADQTCSLAFVPDGVLQANTIITVTSSPSSGVTGGPFIIPAGDPFVIGAMTFPSAGSYTLTFTNNQGLTNPAPLVVTIGSASGGSGTASMHMGL